VRRNAWFNLGKLGAQAVEYLVDFYGPMHDGLNAGEPSDRLFTRWDLLSSAVLAAVEGTPATRTSAGAAVALEDRDGWPSATGGAAGDASLVALPADVEQLRVHCPEAARAWRLAVREALVPLLAGRGRTAGVTSDGDLVLA
jgi:predicted GNAT superfamily acetyltransferase